MSIGCCAVGRRCARWSGSRSRAHLLYLRPVRAVEIRGRRGSRAGSAIPQAGTSGRTRPYGVDVHAWQRHRACPRARGGAGPRRRPGTSETESLRTRGAPAPPRGSGRAVEEPPVRAQVVPLAAPLTNTRGLPIGELVPMQKCSSARRPASDAPADSSDAAARDAQVRGPVGNARYRDDPAAASPSEIDAPRRPARPPSPPRRALCVCGGGEAPGSEAEGGAAAFGASAARPVRRRRTRAAGRGLGPAGTARYRPKCLLGLDVVVSSHCDFRPKSVRGVRNHRYFPFRIPGRPGTA